MIYRFKSKFATQERLLAFPFPVAGKETGIPFSARKIKDQRNSHSGKLTEIILHPINNVETYGIDLLFDRDGYVSDLPDVWGVEKYLIVSDAFKRIISELDSVEHDFLECRWLDKDLQKIDLNQKYYWFLPNRYLQIDESTVEDVSKNFYLEDDENCINILMSDRSLVAGLEQFLIWQCLVSKIKEGKFTSLRTVFYFNDVLLMEMKNKKLKGIDLYTCFNGADEESVVML